MSVCMCVYATIKLYIHTYTNRLKHARTHAYTQTHIHTNTHIQTHTHTHARTHTRGNIAIPSTTRITVDNIRFFSFSLKTHS